MDTSKIYYSGILTRGEEVVSFISAKQYRSQRGVNGMLCVTDKRLLFLERPAGFFPKGFDVTYVCPVGDIVSASSSGLIFRKLKVNVQRENSIESNVFSCAKLETVAHQILEARNHFIEKSEVVARKVIIERDQPPKADDILKRRLARGEITIDEFHRKIQRT